eukprot:2660374-Amphidinium_carterae.1
MPNPRIKTGNGNVNYFQKTIPFKQNLVSLTTGHMVQWYHIRFTCGRLDWIIEISVQPLCFRSICNSTQATSSEVYDGHVQRSRLESLAGLAGCGYVAACSGAVFWTGGMSVSWTGATISSSFSISELSLHLCPLHSHLLVQHACLPCVNVALCMFCFCL